MSPSITVLMPVFNAERFLRPAIQSVLNQTEPGFELLIVDDGSTDSSPGILANHAAADGRVRVLRKPNGGISAALNLGIQAARGELIARMDADDEMLPDRLAIQSAFIRERDELGFCASFMDIIDGEGRALSRYEPEPVDLAGLRALMARQAPITYAHPTVMYRTELVRKLGGYDGRFEPCEDTELFGRMISSQHPGLVIPRVLMRYRRHEGSISGSKAKRQIQMLELTRHNFYQRAAGRPEVPPDAREQAVNAMPLGRRLAYRARIESQTLKQLAGYDRSGGRPVRAGLRLLAAAALQPRKATLALLQVGRRFALGGR